MQFKKTLSIFLLSITVLSSLNAGWSDRWVSIKNYFSGFLKNPSLSRKNLVIGGVGALAITGVIFLKFVNDQAQKTREFIAKKKEIVDEIHKTESAITEISAKSDFLEQENKLLENENVILDKEIEKLRLVQKTGEREKELAQKEKEIEVTNKEIANLKKEIVQERNRLTSKPERNATPDVRKDMPVIQEMFEKKPEPALMVELQEKEKQLEFQMIDVNSKVGDVVTCVNGGEDGILDAYIGKAGRIKSFEGNNIKVGLEFLVLEEVQRLRISDLPKNPVPQPVPVTTWITLPVSSFRKGDLIEDYNKLVTRYRNGQNLTENKEYLKQYTKALLAIFTNKYFSDGLIQKLKKLLIELEN